MERRSKDNTVLMTEGRISSSIIRFAIPIMFTGVLQQLYNTFDSVIVGRFGSSLALAGVGNTASMMNLITNLFIGLSLGASITTAQYFGAEDDESLGKNVSSSIFLAVISGICVTILGLLALNPILHAIGTPSEVLPYSKKYATICFLGMTPTLVYNFLAGILRAVGDSKRPLYYLMISAAVNVCLNLFFVAGLGMDVEGVAIATIVSQTLSCVLAFIRLSRVDAPYRIRFDRLKPEKKYIMKMIRYGVPSGICSAMFSFSNLILASAVNSFGANATAGCAADTSVGDFIFVMMDAISTATVTFVGQNMGAGNFERIKKGTGVAVVIVTIIGITIGMGVLSIGKTLLGIFTNDEAVIQCGLERMSVVATTYFTCGIQGVLNSVLRGVGRNVSSMLVTVFSVCGLRLLWIFTYLPHHRSITSLFMCYPLSWVVTAILLFICIKDWERKHIKKGVKTNV